ncbi:unnamed protein product [Ectocarpus sp. 6 AP-2014]
MNARKVEQQQSRQLFLPIDGRHPRRPFGRSDRLPTGLPRLLLGPLRPSQARLHCYWRVAVAMALAEGASAWTPSQWL